MRMVCARHSLAVSIAVVAVLIVASIAQSRANTLQTTVDLETLPALRITEELRIGSANDPTIGFSRIGSVAVDKEDQVYVFEQQDAQIRVYSPTGKLVRTIGRRGDGPGEFRQSARIGVKGDTIWAVEARGRDATIGLFNRRTAALLGTKVTEGASVPGRNSSRLLFMPSEMRADGSFVSAGYITSQVRGAPPNGIKVTDTLRVPRFLFNTSGVVTDTLTWRREPPVAPAPPNTTVTVNGKRRSVPRPFADEPITVFFHDGRFALDRPTPRSAARATIMSWLSWTASSRRPKQIRQRQQELRSGRRCSSLNFSRQYRPFSPVLMPHC
jgi:hypothetical protein